MDTDSFIIQCTNCKTRNRIPKNRVKDGPVCGKCRRKLPPPSMVQNPVMVTDRSFQDDVLSYPGVVLLDCWAAWCGPCSMIAPIMDQLAREFSGHVKVAKLNIDQNPMTAARYHVLSVPTLLFFKNGRVVHTLAGAYAKPEIERQLRAML
jgi:thioredoxin 2